MIRIVRSLGLTLVLSAFAVNASAQVPDHLQCLKIKDQLAKTSYLADITPDDVTFPAAAGCTIKVPAKLLCVDAVKSNVTPTPPGADDGAPAQKYLCYKTKCPKTEPTATLTDQFGSHPITVKSTGLVCAPVPVADTCTDTVLNGNETDVDCGGGTCPACALGFDCSADGDCASFFCSGGVCATPPASCMDGFLNGSESDVDCGGSCPACSDGSMCGSGSDCLSGTCSGSICVTLLGTGSACSSGGQCSSGNCVDDVCCNTECVTTCEACTAAKTGGMDGICGPIAAATDPDNECIDAGAPSCGTSGSCSGSSSCALYPGGTECAPASCTAGVENAPDQCDGMGFCQDGGQTMCGFYACGPTACNTSCVSDIECAANAYCSGSVCLPKQADGASCMLGAHCLSNFCVDGFCCDGVCTSTCEACSAVLKGSGTDGTCGFIAAGTDPNNECVVGECDGAGMCTP